MTGGGHRVHATNDPAEFLHDSTLLFGEKLPAYSARKGPTKLHRDVIGATGWDGLGQIFKVLNRTTTYLVMRNFDTLPADTPENHGDVDLLVRSPEEVALLLNAEKVFPEEYRVHYRARTLQGKEIFFDLRYPGDGYYDESWQHHMLKSRQPNPAQIYVPEPQDHYFGLLYHALLHKAAFSTEYKQKLEELARQNEWSELVGVLSRLTTRSNWRNSWQSAATERRIRMTDR